MEKHRRIYRREGNGYPPRDSFPPGSTVYNIFRKLQRNGAWEAI